VAERKTRGRSKRGHVHAPYLEEPVIASLIQKLQLLRGVINGSTAYSGPFFVDIDVTSRCNLNCLGCQYHSSESRGLSTGGRLGDISPELIRRLGSELRKMGTREVIITGEGEPFLHPDLFGIIRSLKSRGMRIQLFTNGTLFTRDKARSLLESGLDVLKVSMWASTPEEYRLCYPGNKPETFEKVKAGVRTVTEMKRETGGRLPDILITGPVNRYNYKNSRRRLTWPWSLAATGSP